MRILHVIGSVARRLGGPSKAVLEMTGALAARGHDVEVVTTALTHRGSWSPRSGSEHDDPGTREGWPDERVKITYCQPVWPTRWATSLQMIPVLRALLPATDVVHIHSLYLYSTLIASRLASAYRVPYLLRPHGTLDPYIRRRHRLLKTLYHAVAENETLRRAASVHFTSDRERDLARSALPRGTRTCVIPLGVNLTDYAMLPRRAVARSSFGLPEEGLVCLFLGRLNHKKGLDILAPAFVRLCDQVPHARLLLAGPDDDGLGEKFVHELAKAGAGDRVLRAGFLDGNGVKRALAAADVWVLPSYSENFGLAVVEAMAAGLPVVITDQVNIWSLVQSAHAGVVTACDVDSFFRGMLEVARQPAELRKAWGANGRSLCEREFGWDRIAERLEEVYRTARERQNSL